MKKEDFSKNKQIVFLEAYPTVMTYKIAKIFKENGYETISIKILETEKKSDKFYHEAFSKMISFNMNYLDIKIKNIYLILKMVLKNFMNVLNAIKDILKLKPYVIFARTTPSWPCALTKILFKKNPLIYFAYDIRSSGDLSKKDVKKMQNLPEFKIKAERFCFEHADGIMHKGSPDQLKNINKKVLGEDLKINLLQINFQPYCSKEFITQINKNKLSKLDKEIHTVYIGSVGSAEVNSDNYLLKYFREITKQKIHIHLYMASNTLLAKFNSFARELKGISKSKYLHLHEPLDPKTIIKEISKYDFGLLLPSMPVQKFLGSSNKIASYLEAGIPFINYKELIFVNELMKKYDVGISLGEIEDVKNLKKRIKKINYKKLEKNVIKARQDYLIENQFLRLEKFVEKVVEKTKLQ
jgi:hypothetical protein